MKCPKTQHLPLKRLKTHAHLDCIVYMNHTCVNGVNMFKCNDQVLCILVLGQEGVYCEALAHARQPPSLPYCRAASVL
jgi:hypothetical protein